MTPERWRQALEVFDAALLREQGERGSFLAEVCVQDEELARAVQSLLLAHHHATGFASAPIMSDRSALAVADVLGAYRIDGLLGRGGMGEVYKARDTTLNRDVALKILPSSVGLDSDRVARFKREAQLLASVNHPNIAAIFGFAEHDGIQALVMELVPGSTLAERIARRPIRWQEAVNIAKQIAEALDAAHHLGIVHRDLKPANVKVLPDGTVKVLDFGLATPIAAGSPGTRPLTTPDAASDNTHDGILVGTPAYMSPEQALGQAVDQRTDVWAFGCVLFEMLTSQPAFARSTMADTLRAVVQDEPEWGRLPRIPAALRRLLEKCLGRDPRRRLRSIADAVFDLDDASAPTPELDVAKRGRALPIAVAAALSVGAAIMAARWPPIENKSAAPAGPQLRPLTTYRGLERSPDISPDGSQVAFAWDGERQDNPDIYTKRIASGPVIRLTTAGEEEDYPVWSPDGNSIAFLRVRPLGSAQVVVIPSLGGPERVVAEDAQLGTLDWSPDGKWLIYSAAPHLEQAGFWVQSLGSGARHHVAATTQLDEAAQFSPDGHSLAFIRVQESFSDVHIVWLDAQMRAAGEPRRVTSDGRVHGSPRWLSDSELVFTTGVAGAGSIDRLSLSNAQSRRGMTIDASGGIDVSPTGGRLVVSQNTSDVDVHLLELSEDGTVSRQAGPVIASSRYDAFPLYSPNGERIAFASTRSGDWQVWVCDQDGSNAIQLTSLRQAEASPIAWTPSGQQLGLLHNANGNGMRAYEVDATGGAARPVPELESVSGISSFWWSPDLRWIVYSTREGVWKVPTGGGTATKLTIRNFVPANKGSIVEGYDPELRRSLTIDLNASLEGSVKGPRPSTDRAELNSTRRLPDGGLPTRSGPQFRFFAFARAIPLSIGWVAPHYGASRAPNGRTTLNSIFVAFGADLVLIDNFK